MIKLRKSNPETNAEGKGPTLTLLYNYRLKGSLICSCPLFDSVGKKNVQKPQIVDVFCEATFTTLNAYIKHA